jgi:hypothetical protein
VSGRLSGHCSRFLLEPREPIFGSGNCHRQNLDNDFAMHRGIVGAIHLAHSARPNLRVDFVMAEFCARINRQEFFPITAVVRCESFFGKDIKE